VRGLLLALALLPLALSGCLREDLGPENRLAIAGVDVSAPRVSSGSVWLAVNVTLDNAAGVSGPVRVVVKAFDTGSGLLVVTNEAAPGAIPKDQSVPVLVVVQVPRTSGYRVEVQVLEDGRIAQTAQVQVSNVGALQPNLVDAGLRIAGMDFTVRNATLGRAAIQAAVYLTNEGASASRALRMQVKAREVNTSLLADERWADVPPVALEETRTAAVLLDVPTDQNYEVEAVLWQGNITVERSTGAVQLLPTFTRNLSEELVVTHPDIARFVRDDELARKAADAGGRPSAAMGAPGPEAGLAALAVVGLAIALRRRRT